jgi:hypothetical protein|tara:strand:- start:914 stop:1087 length:174 start_codon:yes stop_codon:yes gene_type:complete
MYDKYLNNLVNNNREYEYNPNFIRRQKRQERQSINQRYVNNSRIIKNNNRLQQLWLM